MLYNKLGRKVLITVYILKLKKEGTYNVIYFKSLVLRCMLLN